MKMCHVMISIKENVMMKFKNEEGSNTVKKEKKTSRLGTSRSLNFPWRELMTNVLFSVFIYPYLNIDPIL